MRHHETAARPTRVLLGVVAVAVSAVVIAGCSSPSSGGGTTAAPAPTATRPAAPEGDLPEALQAELQGALEQTMADYDVPGAAVGVWIPGEGSWTSAAGLADVEGDVAATTDMTWPLRSVTKSYTVTLLLQLVDEGEVSLDDTIDQYVDGVTDGDKITLRELANMSSGNADYTNDNFIEVFSEDPTKIFTLDELNSYMLGEPAQFAPGEKKVYTNANTNLLGAVIEKVTGEQYADVLQERILTPLGQTGTHYTLDATKWEQPHPTGYIVSDGTAEPQVENSSIFAAAGSLFSTLDDARVWAETLATGSLLTPETQEQRLEGAPLDAGPPYDQYALGIGETEGWWGHNGEGIGFTTAVFHNPETGATIAVFMNESNVPDVHPADTAFRAFAEILANGADQ
jgi:D-alanyl-D-alanine carboxypeptidase